MSTNSPEDVGSDFKNGDHGPEGKAGRSRRSKACKQCHALKVRCIPVDDEDPTSSCVRCLNSKKVCEFDTLEPKKRRRKAAAKSEKDSVADLRHQIAALQSEVKYLRSRPASEQAENQTLVQTAHANQSPLASDSSSPPFMTKTDLEKELGLLDGHELSLKSISDEIKDFTTLRENTLRDESPIDVVSLGIIDRASAAARLQMYRTILYPSHSYVKISDDVTVDDLIRTQPYLFNAIMATTCLVRKGDSDFQECLGLEKHAIASVSREILVNGTKSVELVKCLILLSVWYNTPEFFKARRYHLLNQMAVTLLYDLGIVTRNSFTYSGETKTIKRAESSFDDIEYRVLILTLYCSTVGFCLILRRAIFVKWTTYVEECCVILERNPDPHFKDVALFSRLTRELEKVHHIVHSPECYVTNPRISTYTMSELNTRLAVIGKTLTKENHVLLAYYYSIEAYLYQPSSEDLQVRSVGLNCTEELTTRTLTTISQCTSSCLKAMDEFHQLSDEEIAGLPFFHFTRIIYTTGILMRLRYFILSLPSNIEKDLVPRYAIVSVSKLHQRINTISTTYPTNFLMKKMKLVLRLFVQTYVTQVNELITRNYDGTPSKVSTPVSKNDHERINKLAYSILKTGKGNYMGPNSSHGLHLDLLSYAATEHQKSNGDSSDEKPKQEEPTETTQTSEGKQVEKITPVQTEGVPVTRPPSLRPPASEPRFSFGALFGSNTAQPMYQNGDMYRLPLPQGSPGNLQGNPQGNPQGNTQVFPPHDSSTGVPNGIVGEFKDQNIYEFDDEFWSNLLTTDSDKYLFAQDVPNVAENVLYNIFN